MLEQHGRSNLLEGFSRHLSAIEERMNDSWQSSGLSAERVPFLTGGELVKVSFLASQKSRSPLC